MFLLILFIPPLFSILFPSVSAGGCVVMSGGPSLGRWEVKDCRTFKALSACKQSLNSVKDFELPEYSIDPNAPCPPGWESHSGLFYCFKVGTLSFFIALLLSVITYITFHVLRFIISFHLSSS